MKNTDNKRVRLFKLNGPTLSRSDVDLFVETKVRELWCLINIDKVLATHDIKEEKIILSYEDVVKPDLYGIPSYCIRIGTIAQLCTKTYWDDSDIFTDKSAGLFLHLKGKLRVKPKAVWSIIEQGEQMNGADSRFVHQMSCNYFVGEY